MYVRQSPDSRNPREVHIPGNYGGTAFLKETPEPEVPAADIPDTAEEPDLDIPEAVAAEETVQASADTPAFSRQLFGKSGGIGLEELLILGLILLISQNDGKDDLSLLLLLLLFIQ